MTPKIEIRHSEPADLGGIETLYPDAFPDEDLLPLVRDLLDEQTGILSLVAMDGETLVGHVVFTECGLDDGPDKVALLGPLGVATARHGQGIGGALVREGLRQLKETGTRLVCVLGDPAYYGRFGFEPGSTIVPPYPLPPEWSQAWQALGLNGARPGLEGTLRVPPPWRSRALWSD